MTSSVRRRFVRAALLLVVAVGALGGGPVPAGTTTTGTANTSLALFGDPDSYVGAGLALYLTTSDGVFTARKNRQNGVTIRFTDPTGLRYWWLDFAAPRGGYLTPGLYGGAQRFLFQPPDLPGLDVSGEGRGCNQLTGSFEILDVRYGNADAILSLHARFEQHCEFGRAPLVGEVRYAAEGDISIVGLLTPTIEKTRPLLFETRAFSSDPGALSLIAPVLPEGAMFSDLGGGAGVFAWTPDFNITGTHVARIQAEAAGGAAVALTTEIDVVGVSVLWYESEPGDPIGRGQRLFATTGTGMFTPRMDARAVGIIYSDELRGASLEFAAPFGAPLTPGIYSDAMRYPYQNPDRPGIFIHALDVCDWLDGRFEVKEIRRGPLGDVLSFWATFEQQCLGSPGGLHGEIRYRADAPVLVRSPERLVRPARESMTFDVRGLTTDGGQVVLAAEELPSAARFDDKGNGIGLFTWAPTALDAGHYPMTFRGVDGKGRSDFAWTDLEVKLANDEFDGAYVIPSLPFHDTATTLTATRTVQDPTCDTYDATVWYAFTPLADLVLVGSTAGSDYSTTLSAYSGTYPFHDQLACVVGDMVLEAKAGITYYIMVNGRNGGGRLEFSLEGHPPLEIGLDIEAHGQLDSRSGDVTIRGKVTCSRPAPAVLGITLVQDVGCSPRVLQSTSLQVDCTGTTSWSATLSKEDHRFRPLAATVSVDARAHDELLDRIIEAATEDQIVLRPAKPRP